MASLDANAVSGAKHWARCVGEWTAWNHLRTLGGLVAMAGVELPRRVPSDIQRLAPRAFRSPGQAEPLVGVVLTASLPESLAPRCPFSASWLMRSSVGDHALPKSEPSKATTVGSSRSHAVAVAPPYRCSA